MPRTKKSEMNDEGGRRGEIIRAAAKLFRKQGFSGTSINELAREVGLPKGSIYNYVKSKEELLYEIITLGIRAVLPELRAIAESYDSPSDKLRRIVYKDALSMMQYHNFISIFFQDRNNLSTEHYQEYVFCRSEVEVCFKKILQEGMDHGIFRKANVTLTAFAVLGMCNWITQWYQSEGKLSAEEIAAFFAEGAMHMVQV
jgi:AcrR family transcriptional regulator